ncbi:MAG: hypothetical protein JWM99_895 [Verrucomicrobiales bacterium]|nr:hypothetical protein [Verrucomicrobiales bacterium]
MESTLINTRDVRLNHSGNSTVKGGPIPLWIKLSYTSFMAVLVPVYASKYGFTNFLYFCDIALFLALAAVWKESALLAGMAAVGIVVPQTLWCADFLAHLSGFKLIGMTDYMFNPKLPLFLRGLSFFHGWLPFFLIYLVAKLGYNRRSLPAWTVTAWTLMLTSYFFMPRPGAVLSNPKAPVNINYVFGLSDQTVQTWMPESLWLVMLMVALPLLFYIPIHFILKKSFKAA